LSLFRFEERRTSCNWLSDFLTGNALTVENLAEASWSSPDTRVGDGEW
jgi:hypothetical protein